ncbi:MAG: hypothetical protein AB4058_03130 [Microcystaceae cyanobacterium]
MNDKQQPLSLLIALLVVIILGWGIYWIITALIDKLNSVNSDLGKAFITGGVTVLIAVISLVIGKIWEQKIKIEADMREQKIPMYEKQISTFFSIIFAEKYGEKKPNENDIGKAFQDFTEKLIIWGSAEVIQAWMEFRVYDWTNSNSNEGFLKVENLLKAIRKDLGNSNDQLKNGDILKLFINDFNPELLPKKSSSEKEVYESEKFNTH